MPLGTNVAEWAAVASAAGAAVAAAASWAAVRQTRKAARTERMPELHMQAVVDPRSRRVSVRVHNAGGGIAREVTVYLVEGNECLVTYLPPHGMLASGRGVTLETALVKQGALTGRMVGAVIYADLERTIHARDATGTRYTKWSARRLKRAPVSNNDIFAAIVPEVDLNALTPVSLTSWSETERGVLHSIEAKGRKWV